MQILDDAKLSKTHGRVPRLLMAVVLLLASTMLAQTSAEKNKQEKSKEVNETQPVSAGVKVDSARKSADLPVTSDSDTPGETAGGYEIRQSAEFGGRISDLSGNAGVWDTFVNLGTGPRLLEYTLDLHSPTHEGLLFDDLSFSNFGYGGDPNNVSHLRVLKGTLYNFNASFRRDQNIFDYDLLGNPLNPTLSSPTVPILQSPHEFVMTRRTSDVNLSLLPLGKVRFRLGWSRVVNEGNAFSSFHQGTEALLLQPTLNTTDSYSFGVSLRLIPRTSINYDQFYTFYKGDTTSGLVPAGLGSVFGLPGFTLAGGLPVNLGIAFNTPAGQPCATPVLGSGFANPACNGYFSFARSGRNRNSFPTEQFSFQSSYFRRVDFSGRLNYTDAEADLPDFNQLFTGLETRTRARVQGLNGFAVAKRISLNSDFGITIRLTDKLRLVDTFRYENFRIPGTFGILTTSLFGATLLSNPNVFSPATCPPPFTAATCPQHSASSGADITADTRTDFLRQDQKINTFEVEYDFTKRITGHVGYRYERREITQNVADVQLLTFFPTLAGRGGCAPIRPDGTCVTTGTTADVGNDFFEINGHAGIIGFSARPTDSLRISADAEFFSADNTFTRITPRHWQDYRIRGSYKPKPWASLSSTIRIQENRNTSLDIGNLQHNRSYVFSGVFAPADGKWGLDVSYGYNDIFSQTNICFVATPVPAGSLSCGTPFLSGISAYSELSHNGSVAIYARPFRRVSAGVGYTITSTTGNTLILNPNAPTGPLSYNYHLPLATLAIELSKKLTYKTGWNYYDYNEKSSSGPTLPRDFRGNVFTLSLRYSM
ncbi:MAG TPA: hypothetical protein VHA33_06365 [Candidatus Angelobacter sp.]|jgi:hypothetical protein|nr:hypothetical protein [Candidatus Angelobacter sp.]